jgi:hypothetical protein
MRRWLWRGLIAIVAILAFASVSISCGRTLLVTDVQGTPVQGAYAIYHYEGSAFGLVESVTYQATPLAIIKTDVDGRAAIPGGIHIHWPLVQSGPRLAVNLIYAPSLHNGLAWLNTRVPVSREQEFQVSNDLSHVQLADVSADPARWRGTLENLSSLIGQFKSREMRGETFPQLSDELVEHFKNEYVQIINRHGDTPRTRPEMPVLVRAGPDQDKAAWQAMVDKDLGERPLWRDELKRRFGTEIDIYSRPK